jgi:hypothetical protein
VDGYSTVVEDFYHDSFAFGGEGRFEEGSYVGGIRRGSVHRFNPRKPVRDFSEFNTQQLPAGTEGLRKQFLRNQVRMLVFVFAGWI